MPAIFDPETRDALLRAGWYVVGAVGGLTLADFRAAGAPFKSDKYFASQAADADDLPIAWGEAAYRGELLPESLNQPYARAEQLIEALQPSLPAGARAVIAPAALYVHLLVEHHRQRGEWLLQQRYTWAADRSGATHLAVGVFGQQRPLLVSPIPEGSGRGLGVMPVVVPVE